MEQPNILFIIIDALRAKNLSCYGYRKRTSPNIDRLVSDGAILFKNAFSCTNVTDPSLTSIFSGRYPRFHGIVKHAAGVQKEYLQRFNQSGTLLLPEILRSKGYATLAVDWLGRWHKRGYVYYSGVSRQRKTRPLYSLMVESMVKFKPLYFAIRKLFERNKVSLIENAKITTDMAINLMERFHKKKFFLFVHYWDTHSPYNPPVNYVKPFMDHISSDDRSIKEVLSQFDRKHLPYIRSHMPESAANIAEVKARYDGSIAFVDHEIGRLLETLDKQGLSDETLIVLTSDHGESLTEHDIYFDHHGLYDVTIHVPLIFKNPQFPRKRPVKSLVQHVEVVPTLLEILGIKVANYDFDGKSAVPLIQDELEQLRSAVFIEEYDQERKTAIRTNEYKYISAPSEKDAICRSCGRTHGSIKELYDLRKDPGENRNIIEENFAEAAKLQKELSDWTGLFKEKHDGLRKTDLQKTVDPEEEEIKKRLEKLGYI